MEGFKDLPTFEIGASCRLVERSDGATITVHSSASVIFTDFKHTVPIVISGEATVDEAHAFMKRSHVHLNLVVGPGDEIVGIVTSVDLDTRPLKVATTMGIHRSDVAVRYVMTPLTQVHALPYEALADATIGDVITTLQHLGERHMIVAEPADSTIRGVISASDIARKLHVAVDITAKATSFADIYAVIART
jgi:CBS domain-containing protein